MAEGIFDKIPTEILIDILNYVNIHDLIQLRVVNTNLRGIIDDPEFYNKWKPRDRRLWELLAWAHVGHKQKESGFKWFYLWYHKYVVYRASCIRHSYGLLDLEICEPKTIYLMTMHKLFNYLDDLSRHDDLPSIYITTISEMLIGFDVASSIEQCDNDSTSFWNLIYGYIQIHCTKNDGSLTLLEEFKSQFYTGAPLVVKYREI
jgi:hypothetical protein